MKHNYEKDIKGPQSNWNDDRQNTHKNMKLPCFIENNCERHGCRRSSPQPCLWSENKVRCVFGLNELKSLICTILYMTWNGMEFLLCGIDEIVWRLPCMLPQAGMGKTAKLGAMSHRIPSTVCVCKCVSHSVRGVKDVSYIPGGFSQGEAACLDLARIRCLSLPVWLQKLTAETETAAGGTCCPAEGQQWGWDGGSGR